MNSKFVVLIQTSKDRVRYLDTTFYSILRSLPRNIDIYITSNNCSVLLTEYLNTNNNIALGNDYYFPNDNASWNKQIGFIENKTHTNGIHKLYKEHITYNCNSHYYEKICRSLYTVIEQCDDDIEFILRIEDDVIFKKGFYNAILRCMQQASLQNIGRIALYNSRKDDSTIVHIPHTQWKGSDVCVLFKIDVLKRMNLNEYKFTHNDLPSHVRREVKGTVVPDSGGDNFFTSFIEKYALAAVYTQQGVCQHIGTISSIYTNVKYNEHWDVGTQQRCFFDIKNNTARVDCSVFPPYIL